MIWTAKRNLNVYELLGVGLHTHGLRVDSNLAKLCLRRKPGERAGISGSSGNKMGGALYPGTGEY